MDGFQNVDRCGPNEDALRVRSLRAADRRSQQLFFRSLIGIGVLRVFGDVHTIAQCDHGGSFRMVGDENCAEVLVFHSRPMEGTGDGAAATHALSFIALNLLVVLPGDTSRTVGTRRCLVAEAGWPGEVGRRWRTLIHNRCFHLEDRKSTRLNSSHPSISYAVFCLKKKKKKN